MKPLFSLALLALAIAPAVCSPADRITAASLRGHVSFLASDLLEGRGTPSRGLEIAADYIVSEFRRIGLESPPNGEYSQIADFNEVTDRPEHIQLTFSGPGDSPRFIPSDRIAVESFHGANLKDVQVFKWAPNVPVEDSLAGKAIMLRSPADPSVIGKLALSKPDAIIELARTEPESREGRVLPTGKDLAAGPSIIAVPESDLEARFDRLHNGLTSAHVNLHIAEPIISPIRLRNVVGVLPGSDATLRNQYILITAHYDHLGLAPTGKDRIFNGANDNASGVATVLELAQAFAGEHPHPRRTLVFMCFFGEEEGLLGSMWYVKHPLFPLSETVANINFEQMGIPESSEGLPVATLGVTGFDYSDLPESIESDLESAGVRLKDVRHNDEYFDRSDNYSFAQVGIPAHTFVAALDYPDYHKVSDEWPKLNYDNMAQLDRGIAVAILDLADRDRIPKWSEASKKAKDYDRSWHALHSE